MPCASGVPATPSGEPSFPKVIGKDGVGGFMGLENVERIEFANARQASPAFITSKDL